MSGGRIIREEFAHPINGVEGRMFRAISGWHPSTFSNQKWLSNHEYTERGQRHRITVNIEWDDDCKNGHNTFSVTGQIDRAVNGRWCNDCGGCIHDEIAKRFPQLAPLIRWHLVSSDGPMHYVGNTLYHASNRDYRGLLKGERRQIRNGKTGALAWHLVPENDQGAAYLKLASDYEGDTPPEPPRLVWAPWCHVGEGKARELEHARSTAVWPEATDEQLTQDPEALKAALLARLPALLAALRADVEGAGFLWECPK